MTKGSMPTHGQLIASGQRVLIFLEKDEHKTVKPNYETGLYPQGLVMTQKCFMARTLWNRAKELMNPSTPIESSLVTADFVHLPPSNFFVMIDYYTTVLGANYDDLVDLHTNLFQKMDRIFARICEYVGRGAAAVRGGAGGPAPPPSKTCPPAYMFMVDFISPEIISTCIDRTILLLGRQYTRPNRLTRNRAILVKPMYTPIANKAVTLAKGFAKGFANRISAVFSATTPAEHRNVVTVKQLEELHPITELNVSQEELEQFTPEELTHLHVEKYMVTSQVPRFKIVIPTEISKELKIKIKKIELEQYIRSWKLLPHPLPPAKLMNNSSLAVRDPAEIKNAEEYLKNGSILPALKAPIRALIAEYHESHDASDQSRIIDILRARLASSRPSPSKRRLRRRTRKTRRFTS